MEEVDWMIGERNMDLVYFKSDVYYFTITLQVRLHLVVEFPASLDLSCDCYNHTESYPVI